MATAQTGEVAVPLNRIEEELSLLLTAGQRAGKLPLLRARMANLMVYCNSAELAAHWYAKARAISEVRRALLVLDCATIIA